MVTIRVVAVRLVPFVAIRISLVAVAGAQPVSGAPPVETARVAAPSGASQCLLRVRITCRPTAAPEAMAVMGAAVAVAAAVAEQTVMRAASASMTLAAAAAAVAAVGAVAPRVVPAAAAVVLSEHG